MIRTSSFEFRVSRQRGVVMILTILAMILLVSLVLFTLNMGQQVDRRADAQTSADAAAVAGATWVARSMNVVAMNNLAMSRDIALVCVMDSMPTASRFALVEQTAMHDALRDQLSRGLDTSGGGPAQLTAQLNTLMNDYLAQLQDEMDQLTPVDQFFRQNDMTPITWYNPPSSGHGALWRQMTALDELNQATLESIGNTSQTAAVQGGHATQTREQHADAFVTPLVPTLPAQRGSFADFQRPVKFGLLPAAVDHPTDNRGPYDTVFGFHALVRPGTFTPGDSDVVQGGHGGVPIGSGAGSIGTWTPGPPTAYHTWGSFGQLLGEVESFSFAHLRNSRLAWWTRMLSLAKLHYLWPNDSPYLIDNTRSAWPPRDVYEPQWITDFNQAAAEAAAGKVNETAFFVVEIKSRYPTNDADFMSPGSWALVTDGGQLQPRIVRTNGWTDPRTWTAQQITDYGWRDAWQYTAWFDSTIGLTPLLDQQGNPVAQPVYRIDHYYFAGANLGPAYVNPDPFQGFDATSGGAPAPTDLDHNLVPRDAANFQGRRQYLTFLGTAMTDRVPPTWPSRFTGTTPSPVMLAMAQAQVFNNHSWDLWTPMWRTQLQPITDVTAWAQTMTAPGSGGSSELNPTTVQTAQQYLSATATLSDLMSSH
ncbi:MAG: pilus assembly protein TadG-related protein [Phycisphaerales bacterium]